MTGCRIGKVKFKSGGIVYNLNIKPRGELHKSIEAAASKINDESLLLGWFLMRKDRTVVTGWSYEEGVCQADMVGAAEVLKTTMQKVEWND